ncbi:MAG: hypothetical protein V4547_16280 [Bacteroidota bacterium]
MKKIVLLFLLAASGCSSQQVGERVLLSGTYSNWNISERYYGAERVVFFSWLYSSGTKVSEMRYYYKENVLDLACMLREFSYLPTKYQLNYYYTGFRLETTSKDNYVYLYDHKENPLKLSKTKCKSLAAELERAAELLTPNP